MGRLTLGRWRRPCSAWLWAQVRAWQLTSAGLCHEADASPSGPHSHTHGGTRSFASSRLSSPGRHKQASRILGDTASGSVQRYGQRGVWHAPCVCILIASTLPDSAVFASRTCRRDPLTRR
jgi:hypothetical protein